jgi:saccharopine dehydrogenase-like NADP-dependent oxidoreductase
MKIIVLGGGGAMGMVTVRDLAESSEVSEIIIADTNLKRAEEVAKWAGSKKITLMEVDITDYDDLIDKISNADVIANAAPYHLNFQVTKAAIDVQKPLTDLGGVYHVTLQQLKLNDKSRKTGVTVILGCGVAPGIADILAKYGADKLESVDQVHIRYGEVNLEHARYKWSFRTVLDEYTIGPVVYRQGEFKQLSPFSGKHVFRFPEPIGERPCCYALYSGIATLPKTVGKGVNIVDCAMSYVEEDEQRIRVLSEMGLTKKEPIRISGVEISPREFLLKCAPPPDTNVRDVAGVVVEVSGKKDGEKRKYTYSVIHKHHETYGVSALAYLTGTPLSIIAQMLAKGKISRTGVLPVEASINPVLFFTELSKREIKIQETCQTAQDLN